MPVRRRNTAAVLVGCLLGLPLTAQQPGPPGTGGIARFDLLLQHLAETRRVLVIGAHPDDEDTQLITWASRHLGAEAAYLSLTRGEGGQNLIGDELGIALGLLRTRELEAARAIDGGRQFFTRAYDFGYTRSLAETERFWPPDAILKDVVRVIRRFRPHVIVTVFSGTARDGHGQHQYSAVIGRRGYEAAGDPAMFPELHTEEGLEPWRPLRLYRSTRFAPDQATLVIDGGVIDHRVGKTIHQIAMESRSQHRSQDFGVLQAIGPSRISLALVDSVPSPPRPLSRTGEGGRGSLFAGIPREHTWLTQLADSLRLHVAPVTVATLAPVLTRALARLPRTAHRERRMLEEAIAIAGGVLLDARAPHPVLAAGEEAMATVDRWTPGDTALARATVAIPTDRADQPYFLAAALQGALYDWSAAAPGERGLPFAAETPLTHRTRDQGLGEVRTPLRIAPRLGVALDPDLVIWPEGDTAPRTLTVTVTHVGRDTVEGTVGLFADGWSEPARGLPSAVAPEVPFAFAGPGSRTLVLTVPAPDFSRGDNRLRAIAHTAGGRSYDRTVRLISYPHIRSIQYLTDAVARVEVAALRLPDAGRVGYVRGAADRTPEVLARLGLPLTLLDSARLARDDLSAYDVIVIGPRAYESDSSVVRHNARLLDYVRQGGHLVVQYQQYDFVNGGYAPYPLTIGRPHDRITDETAPVRLLVPRHPAFTIPNRLTQADWDGWPQERGLYFAASWDDAYTPLLEMQDPERDPVRGGLLLARYGAGTYIYTGISFFRAVPAGNPGALRLLLNLIALKAADLVP